MVSAQYWFQKPEYTEKVKCYLLEPDAVKHECPKGTRKQIFAKQGRWLYASGPTPGEGKGTVTNDSVVGNGGPDNYNYVTRIVLTNGKVKDMWMNHGIRQPGTQVVTFADDPPPDADYPRIMGCTKCINCKKGELKEIQIPP